MTASIPTVRPRASSPDLGSRALSVLDALYDAALDPSQPLRWLERLRDGLGVAGVSYMPPSIGAGPWHSVGFSPEFRAAYEQHFRKIDPWFPALSRKIERGECSVVGTSGALLAHDEFVCTEFFNDFFRPHGFDDGFGVIVDEGDRSPFSLHVVRSLGSAVVEPWQLALLVRLVPHIRRAARIVALASHASHDALTKTALESLTVGVLFVNARGGVEWLNRSATSMLAGPFAALSVLHGALTARTHAATRALQRAIDDAVSPRPTLSSSVLLPRVEPHRPWIAVVLPVGVERAECHAFGEARAVLFLRDPEVLPQPPATLLRSLYGLTPAETRLALLVGQGLAPRVAADQLGIAWNTARVHLARVFSKTSTSRQPELVRLLASLTPVVHTSA